jgi:uncharacterized LabA/DUF88 family protein
MAQETKSNAALLIDWENFDTRKGEREKIQLSWFRDEGEKIGNITACLAFAGFADSQGKLISALHRNRIEPRFTNTKKIKNGEKETIKNAADLHLCVEAMKIAYQYPAIDCFILASGDGGFVPLVRELKSMGKRVVVFVRDKETLSSNLKKEVENYLLYSSGGEVQ